MATYNWASYFFMEQTAKYFGLLIGRLVSVVAAAISRVAAGYTEK